MIEDYKAAVNTGIEDLQNVERDVSALAQKYIFPIDRIRGYSTKDPVRPFESRCHAFYRYLGFPVATESNSFYNPGYNPPTNSNKNAVNSKANRKDINSKFNQNVDLKNIISSRETNFKILRNIFAKQDLSSSLYAIALKYIRPFQVINKDYASEPFHMDQQRFSVYARASEIEIFSLANKDLISDISVALMNFAARTPLGGKLDSGSHILKPFLVDPDIANDIHPPTNIICVPFLKNAADTRINKNTMLLRPGIETIIRIRFLNAQTDSVFLENIKKILTDEVGPGQDTSNLDKASIISSINALSEENDLTSQYYSDFLNVFDSSVSSIQLTTINALVKTIKILMRELYLCSEILDTAHDEISWLPLPGVEGPEIVRGSSLNRYGTTLSGIDKQIVTLKTNIFNANSSNTDFSTLGSFATPFTAYTNNNVKQMNSELEVFESRKKRYSDEAFKAMSNMELISGEVSGLGLVDILAIYTALWSLEDQYLLGFLDSDSFDRLYENNPKLRGVQAVEERKLGLKTTTITESLVKFEEKLVNVFAFADKELGRQRLNPSDDPGGTIES